MSRASSRGGGRRAAGGLRPGALPALALLVCALASCARKAPPSGGPPDIVPPVIVSSDPDSAQARVPLDAPLAITFSKSMEPVSTGDAVSLAPRIAFRQRRWSSHTLTLVLQEAMRPNQTYTLFVGPSARDRHGNNLVLGRAIVFSTADTFPPGVIEGKIDARGFPVAGTYLWCYRGARQPDSTARDFDALGLADEQGRFSIPGLPVPGSYHLWAFADLNRNRSYEPDKDVLAPADTTIQLTPGQPVARDLLIRAVNPRAPGHVRGIVLDPTGDTLGVLRVVAVAQEDSTRRVLVDVDRKGTFDLQLAAGIWVVRAWRDEDRNRAWRTDVEPASELERYELAPAQEINDVHLTLKHWIQQP